MHFECVMPLKAPTVRTMPAQGNALGLQSEKYRGLNGRDKKWGQPFQGTSLQISLD